MSANRLKMWGALAACLTTLSLASCQAPQSQGAGDVTAVEQDGGDWIELQQGVWIPVKDPFGERLKASRLAFRREALSDSARDLREAADSLLREVPGLSDHGKDRLRSAARELGELAARVERGAESLTGFDQILDRACQAEEENLWPLAAPNDWVHLEGAAEEHFVAAQEALERGDPRQSSLEVGKATAFVRLQIGRSDLASHAALEESVEELRALARDLEAGKVKDIRSLDPAFSRAHRALAAAHQLAAKQSWNAQAGVRAGLELQASADHLERALKWSRETTEQETADTLTRTRKLAEKLVTGQDRADRRTDAEIQAIAREIEQFGQAVARSRLKAARPSGTKTSGSRS